MDGLVMSGDFWKRSRPSQGHSCEIGPASKNFFAALGISTKHVVDDGAADQVDGHPECARQAIRRSPRLDQPGGDGQDILGQVMLDAQHVPAQLVVVTDRHVQLD